MWVCPGQAYYRAHRHFPDDHTGSSGCREPAKKYVHTLCHRTSIVVEAVTLIREEMGKPQNNHVDGILSFEGYAVIITGTLTDEEPGNVKSKVFSGACDSWFYLHVEE